MVEALPTRNTRVWARMYGREPVIVDPATMVNDGPLVRDTGRTPPLVRIERLGKLGDVLVLEPVVNINATGFRLRWTEEMGALLAKRMSASERDMACRALGARLCLDLYRMVYELGNHEQAYHDARSRSLRGTHGGGQEG